MKAEIIIRLSLYYFFRCKRLRVPDFALNHCLVQIKKRAEARFYRLILQAQDKLRRKFVALINVIKRHINS